jgi:hypothetical protein
MNSIFLKTWFSKYKPCLWHSFKSQDGWYNGLKSVVTKYFKPTALLVRYGHNEISNKIFQPYYHQYQ